MSPRIHLTRQELSVDDNDGRDPWDDDKLENRHQLATELNGVIELVTGQVAPSAEKREPDELVKCLRGGSLTISLDGKWGTGKTFFLERWKKYLHKQYSPIYYNAWSHDFFDDPLIPLLHHVIRGTSMGRMKRAKLVKQAGQFLKPHSVSVGATLPGIISASAMWLSDRDKAGNTTKKMKRILWQAVFKSSSGNCHY